MTAEVPYGPGHPSWIAPLHDDLVELLRGQEFDKLVEPRRKPTPNASPKPLKCPSCRKRFWTNEARNTHRREVHKD
jgi:hypothetical protein